MRGRWSHSLEAEDVVPLLLVALALHAVCQHDLHPHTHRQQVQREGFNSRLPFTEDGEQAGCDAPRLRVLAAGTICR